ncbi:MAG: hypothetical protein K2X82_30300, partial [Gemmataceae bacterium]|nr:hypothetical protein [Gemmataceae bacterium]
ADELALVVAGDRRTPDLGRAGVALLRKMPHAAAANFLPRLGHPAEVRAGRHSLTPDAALELAFLRLREPVLAESDAVGLALPAYLSPTQVAKAAAAAGRAKLALKGTAAAPVAVAAHRAALLLDRPPPADLPRTDGRVIPIRPHGGPAAVVVVEADACALSAAVVGVDRDEARLLATEHWPKLGLKVWFDKLLDALADRCVRLCRRDPRDSADAEQALFEQLPDAMDRARAGLRVSLTVRTAAWYQDLVQPADEFDGNCPALARAAAEAVRAFVADAGLPVPPRAVWLSHPAGRLPGLARAVYQNSPEGTAVEVLPPSAAAHAAAALVPRWLAGELPKTHLDAAIRLDFSGASGGREAPDAAGTRSGSRSGG